MKELKVIKAGLNVRGKARNYFWKCMNLKFIKVINLKSKIHKNEKQIWEGYIGVHKSYIGEHTILCPQDLDLYLRFPDVKAWRN